MDPSFTLIAGPLKAGKTSTAIAAFPTSVFIAAPGALAPAEAVWGVPQPRSYDLETFLDIIRFVDKGCDGHLAKAPGVVIDDASLIADRTITFLTNKGIGGYDLWGAVFAQCIRLRDNLLQILISSKLLRRILLKIQKSLSAARLEGAHNGQPRS